MIKPYTISLPEEIKAKGDDQARFAFKNFSEYIKDLIIEDINKKKTVSL